MAISIDNFQESLALIEFFPMSGEFPSRDDGAGTGHIPLGAIRTFAGTFAPGGTAAEGQLLPIAQNTVVFSLLGTTYGGDGQTTFALPDLQARTPIGAGQGPGLDSHSLGAVAGTPEISLTQGQLPATLGGTSQPIDNAQPSLPITYIIRTTGNFPSSGGGGTNFIGEIVKFAGNFAPEGYLKAEGQLLSIAEHEALFTLIGTTYGGDGQTTFALPDLRGRNVVGTSSSVPIGTLVGQEDVTLTNGNIPANVGGGGAAFDNEGPGLALTYMIAVEGVFPSRDGGSAPPDQPFYGEIAVFAGDFAPRGWAKAEGQLLPINQNQALFSLLGTTYGGDGRTTFALPDLRGRTAIGTSDDVPVGTVLGDGDQSVLSSHIPDIQVTGGPEANSLWGGDGNDQLNGAGGSDTLRGNNGNDTLDGGAANDKMAGYQGNDTYVVDNAGDLIAENANNGHDTVQSSISFTLGANFEDLTLLGTANINSTGNGLANVLRGSSGDNVLNGGAGVDIMAGYRGNDTYVVDNAGDVIGENAGNGTDTVQAGFNFALGANFENLTLTGTGNARGTGNALANVLRGNTGNNVLNGGAGNDNLEGGHGLDWLTGGGDADKFVFRQSLVATSGADHISDFGADDYIYFDHPSVTGPLNPVAFVVGANALDANDRFIYYAPYNALYFDQDGNGAAAKVLFAVFDNGYVPTAADIILF